MDKAIFSEESQGYSIISQLITSITCPAKAWSLRAICQCSNAMIEEVSALARHRLKAFFSKKRPARHFAGREAYREDSLVCIIGLMSISINYSKIVKPEKHYKPT
jgi:hypothetical protein